MATPLATPRPPALLLVEAVAQITEDRRATTVAGLTPVDGPRMAVVPQKVAAAATVDTVSGRGLHYRVVPGVDADRGHSDLGRGSFQFSTTCAKGLLSKTSRPSRSGRGPGTGGRGRWDLGDGAVVQGEKRGEGGGDASHSAATRPVTCGPGRETYSRRSFGSAPLCRDCGPYAGNSGDGRCRMSSYSGYLTDSRGGR